MRPVMPEGTPALFAALCQCAAQKRLITYGELGRAVGLPSRGLGPRLGYIRDEVCRAHGRPWLNALAVSAVDGRPGARFWPAAFAALTAADRELVWRGIVLQVFAYDWRDVRVE